MAENSPNAASAEKEDKGPPMKKILTNAPLITAVIHLEISPCPELKLKTKDLEDAVLSKMIDLDLPDYVKAERKMTKVDFGLDGNSTREESVSPRHVYRSASKMKLFEISDTSFILKTTDYHTFEEFAVLFLNVLEDLLKLVPQANKSLLKRVGLRYVDLIAPEPDADLKLFIDHEFLPASLSMVENGKKLQGQMVAISETAPGSQMRVAFEEIRAENGTITKLLPFDLGEHDPRCTMEVPGKESWKSMTCDTYGILDIDHARFYEDKPPTMDLITVEESLKSLYNATNQVFWSAITDHAQKCWE
jgi:uncharacterized protein (TIGR04255 family)